MLRKKLDYQAAVWDDPLLYALTDSVISGWPDDIKYVPKALYPYHAYHDVLTTEDGIIFQAEALIIPPAEREKVLCAIHEGQQDITKCQYLAQWCVYWAGINSDIKQIIEACYTCQWHCPQEPRQPLKLIPTPECHWQHPGADFLTFNGSQYLVVVDYYSKMPIARKMPTSQCNAAKTISMLKELFAEHGIQESLHTDNGPQFACALFARFADEWNFVHHTGSPTNPWIHGQAEAEVKIVKGLLTWSMCSDQDPHLALLTYRSTPVDVHLCSPAEMLYHHALCTTVPQCTHHKDPHVATECDWLDGCTTLSVAHHDYRGCRQKAPLFAGEIVFVINNDMTLWLPATVVWTAYHGSYIV